MLGACCTMLVVKVWTAGTFSVTERLSVEHQIYIERCADLDYILSRLRPAEHYDELHNCLVLGKALLFCTGRIRRCSPWFVMIRQVVWVARFKMGSDFTV